VKNKYFDSIMKIERLHRLFLDVITKELDIMKIKDVSNIQCFMLYNIGTKTLTVGEIKNRGYYLGSNVTYNLKKMVEFGYIVQEASSHDRRSSHVKLSEKGLKLYLVFQQMLEKHSESLEANGLNDDSLRSISKNLQTLESFWSFLVMHNVH